MKRRISLYIAEQLCDLDDDALVLLNVQREDLNNPAIMLNSYSQAVTLPGTAVNDIIFGHYFRADHSVAGSYNPLVRVPFSIFDETGDILASGYCKLLNVKMAGQIHTYEVQLYGSFGEFIYGLAYDADGNKKTLASLDYLGGGDTELDFTINTQAVKDAWFKMANPAVLPNGPVTMSISGRGRTAINTDYQGAEVAIHISGNSGGRPVDILFFNASTQIVLNCGQYVLTSTTTIVIATIPSNATQIGCWDYSGQAYTITFEDIVPTPTKWDVINFAPCYNGTPDGEFEPGKALADASDLGLTIPPGYSASTGGYVLLDFPQDVDEWAAKDLRSYLQRPVLSVWALLQAIANPANNGGWTLDLSDINSNAEWPYCNMWLTRPLLPSLGTYKQTTGSITATPSASATSGPDLVSIALANVPAGTDVTLRATFGLQVNLSSAPGQTTMFTGKDMLPLTEYRDVWFLQAVGYASDNSVVAASPVTIFGPDLSHVSDLAKFAYDCTFVPTLPIGQTAEYVAHTGFDAKSLTGSSTAFSTRGDFSLEVKGKNMASAKVLVKRGRIYWKPLLGKVDSVQNLATLYTSEDNSGTGYGESTSLATGVVVTASSQSSSTLRSGAKVTKQMLLSTEGTPADYLLALCKSFGLYILADGASKTARILRRDTLFQNETIDLTDRVDTSQEIELEPIAFDAKWYDWKHENVGGAFVNEYKATEGRDYGAQRVNTGYDFDASVKNVLDGVVLKGAAAVRASGPFWNYITDGGKFKPSPFLLPGNKFTSWDSSNQGADTDIPSVGSGATITEYAGGYDKSERAEFRDKDGKPVDGADVLLLAENFLGIPVFDSFEDFLLTDDVADMDTIVGKPCWMVGSALSPLSVPHFSRYVIQTTFPDPLLPGVNTIIKSLDFGIPAEVDIPDLTYDGNTIYDQAWKKYIADRLDMDTKVLRCRVRLDGLQVGQGLLRKFWWYRNSLWVLNKITNYSLTTFDPAECEFIQVQDMDNYLNGQY